MNTDDAELPHQCDCPLTGSVAFCPMAGKQLGPLAREKCRTDLRYRRKFWGVAELPEASTYQQPSLDDLLLKEHERWQQQSLDDFEIKMKPDLSAPLLDPVPERKRPSLTVRAVNFAKALTKHALDSWRKTTEEQIQERLAICQGCESFDAAKEVCLECGCDCSAASVFMNKLAWASESCPLGKWPAILAEAPPGASEKQVGEGKELK